MKKNIAVIFGGVSSEYEISLMSAVFVLNNIDKEKYNVITIGITKEGNWILYQGATDDIKTGQWIYHPMNVTAFISPDRKMGGIVAFFPNKTEIIPVHVAFPVLHGKNGEDGTIQGLLSLSGIPYVGCGTLSSAVCMDKAFTHSLLCSANIEQANFLWFYADRFDADPEKIKNKICSRFTFPVFVKPANAGSSVGISKVSSVEELDQAIMIAAKEDVKIVVEQSISGREVECAVLGGRDAIASGVGEIATNCEFYDYEDKYVNGTSETIIPARIDNETTEKIRETALRAYKYLGCQGLSRIDFFVSDDGKIILNEINTIPGFTAISMYPKLWLSTGMSPLELVSRLIDTAFRRYE